jgi:predicted GIY-YIG superfamily endonuclease
MIEPCVYILQCADDSYYVGCTSNLPQRLDEHRSRRFCGYTASRLPVELKSHQNFATMLEAILAEKQIKGWTRATKEALIAGDYELLRMLAQSHSQEGGSVQNDSA